MKARLASLSLLLLAVACGPSPAAAGAAPTGTLVVVIRQGPERVPFQPKVDRIRRANAQLGEILGHSLQIEIDGSLLPQDHDGAQDVIARIVEGAARDIASMKHYRPHVMAFATASFERLVVRYSPAEAARREQRWAELDAKSKTIDIALKEATFGALEQGDISKPILTAFEAVEAARYANVLPDRLPEEERKAWLGYHRHRHRPAQDPDTLGSVHALLVIGAVTMASSGDAEARKYLVEDAFVAFSSTYHHHQAAVENAGAQSRFRLAENAYIGWLKNALPTLTVEERAHVGPGLWVHDFRKSGERDAYAGYAFPGIDKMGFGFAQADAWVAANHPSRVRVFDEVIDPVRIETTQGELRFQSEGKHDADFYRWSLAAPAREDAFVKELAQRRDPRFLATAFYNAHTALRDEASYLRFLRRFEPHPEHWRAGAEVQRAVVYRPSAGLLEESRRHWREVPFARGHALFYFARQAEGSYHPEVDWPEMLQDVKAGDAALNDVLSLGWPAFSLAPVYWPQLQRTSTRLAIIEAAALDMLAQDVKARPGNKDVGGVLAAIARVDCEDDNRAEVAALRKWAETQMPRFPGQGFSQIIEATDPKECSPRKRPVPAARPSAPKKPRWKEGDPLPPKDPFF